MNPEHTFHAKVLRRAAGVLGSKAALRAVLRVPMPELDLWMLGAESPPSHVFLQAVDIVTDRLIRVASNLERRSIEARRNAELVRQNAIEARRSAEGARKDNAELWKEMRVGLLERAAELMGSDAASVQQLTPDGNQLVLLDWDGFHRDSAAYWQRVSAGNESACGAALKKRQRVIVRDVTDPACGLTDEGVAYFRLSGLAAVQSTPLVSRDGRLLGMLSTHWRRPCDPDERDLALFDVFARHAADVLERTGA